MSRTAQNLADGEAAPNVLGTPSSGNIFQDLGFERPEEELLKATLINKIDEMIEVRGLTQVQAAEVMGIPQPKVSDLRNGRDQGFSVERLFRLLNRIGVDVTVSLSTTPDWAPGSLTAWNRDRDAEEAKQAPEDGWTPSFTPRA